MRIILKIVTVLAVLGLLAGCSDIGKISGVDISRISGDNPNPTFCQPPLCVLGAAAVVGGTAWVIHDVSKGGKKMRQDSGVGE